MSACGLILGGDQHVDSKSHDYTVLRLDRDTGSGWQSLTPVTMDISKEELSKKGEALSPNDAGDVAFEHKPTGAIISVNSVCGEFRDASLGELSRYLLMGVNARGPVASREIEIDREKALESTVDATMNQRRPSGETEELPVRVRAVVLRKAGCTFDLMFIAGPKAFEAQLPAFQRFLEGFHVK